MNTPRNAMTARRFSLLALAVAVIGTLVSACNFNGAYDLPLPGAPVSRSDAIQVTAEFNDILDIVPKSPVMVDDVTVGEVTDVERVGWHARITMLVRKDVVLPDNASAEIKQVSLLGEKYVALEPPGGGVKAEGRLQDGDNIPLARTGRNPEVEEVLGALSFLLSGGGVAQLGTITRELNKAMDGRESQLRDLLTNLTNVIGSLDDQKQDILNALQSMSDLTATLNAGKKTITGALDEVGPAVKVLADQTANLTTMLHSLDKLGVVGTRVIRASKANLLKSLDHLQPILANLRASGNDIGPGLNLLVSFPFPKEASEVVKGDYANTSIRADLNLAPFLPTNGLPTLPSLPTSLPTLPTSIPTSILPTPTLPSLTDIQQCLASANIASSSCQKVLGSASQLSQLKAQCGKSQNAGNPVCQTINAVPTTSGGSGGVLPILPGLTGLGLRGVAPSSLRSSLVSKTPVSSGSMATFYSGGAR